MGEEAEDEVLEEMMSRSVGSLGRKGEGKERKAGCVLGKSWAIWSRRMTAKGPENWYSQGIDYQRMLGCDRWGVVWLVRTDRWSVVKQGLAAGVETLGRG